MTFVDIIGSMSNTNNAAKRSGSMTGYMWRFMSGDSGSADCKNGLPKVTVDGDFYVAFVQIDGDQFIYKYTDSTKSFEYKGCVAGKTASGHERELDNVTSPSSSDKLVLDGTLLKHICTGQDWTVGKQSDFESVRMPATGTEW